MARRDPSSTPRPIDRGRTPARPASALAEPDPDDLFVVWGEGLRRVALGLTATLFVTRAFFESEGAERGDGLVWVFVVLAVAALAVASTLLSGTLRFRWTWADAAVVALVVLVGLSAGVAADRRAAINVAWEWGGVGIMYVLARNLPRSRAESSALVGVLVATAVAVAAYGLYQVPVEFPHLRALFRANPEVMLRPLGLVPGTPSAEAFAQRLLSSNEPFSTFALANSLAGFLIGPLAVVATVALRNLGRDRKPGGINRATAYLMAALPGLILLVCLILTKSRSAMIGWLVALAVLAWRSRRGLPRPVLIGSLVSGALLLAGLVGVGYSTRLLDREILTEASKSFRYRWEYWVGTWDVLRNTPSPYRSVGVGPILPGASEESDAAISPRAPFWMGVGPGNFGRAYLGHKLPQASEEIQDPHNLILDVWASSGIFAAAALVLAIGLALREIFRPVRGEADPELDEVPAPDGGGRTGWLIVMGGLGWLGVVLLGHLNPFQGDVLGRWLVLGVAWVAAVGLGSLLWKRRPIPAEALGLAGLAMAINLLAAGGIAIPTVALMFWLTLALGLNLRDDRACGTLRELPGIGGSVVLAAVWAALAGTFFGAVVPFWRSRAELAVGDALMNSRPPAFEAARAALTRSLEADHYNVAPWLSLAELEYRYWRSPESATRKEPRWERVLFAMDGAVDPKWRDPDNLDARRRQASYAREILAALPADATPMQILQLRATIVKAMRRSVSVYPTNAGLRLELARASADLGMYPDAVREARIALELDDRMPHRDKKLAPAARAAIQALIPQWEEQAKALPKTDEKPSTPASGAGR